MDEEGLSVLENEGFYNRGYNIGYDNGYDDGYEDSNDSQNLNIKINDEFSGYYPNIDPRRFVIIKYKARMNSKPVTIGRWSKNTFNLFTDRIDKTSEIQIQFLIDSLINTPDFSGSLSLSAKIKGINGERNIEVNPYSIIGQNQTGYGIKSISVQELTKRLDNIVSDIEKFEENSYFIGASISTKELTVDEAFGYDPEYQKLKNLFAKLSISKVDSVQRKLVRNYLSNSTKTFYVSDVQRYTSYEDIIFKLQALDFNGALESYQQLLVQLGKAIRVDETEKRRREGAFENLSKNQVFLTEEIYNYLQSFDNVGEDATKAFLRHFGLDSVNYNGLVSQIKLLSDELRKSEQKFSQESSSAARENFKVEFQKQNNALIGYFSILLKSISYDSYSFGKNGNGLTNSKKRIAYSIYKKLIDAKINMLNESASSGEIITIYLTWDNGKGPVKIQLADFEIRETGWEPKILDSFFLVNSYGGNDDNPSPSKFKGAAGVSLLMTYFKEGIKKNGVPKTDFWGNSLQPSFGINVSYLDMSIDKDFEIGCGFVMGLFNNKVLFNYGYNLHTENTYFGLGFSFVNLAQKNDED
ncbi:MAG: hypothetical protein ABJH98_06600 [Reichenbachiella sp.]|uniref:hypothetical protein n=1 Tax=Reichenbachiella sp. TaxID=2184521 RepID=UPI00329A4C33